MMSQFMCPSLHKRGKKQCVASRQENMPWECLVPRYILWVTAIIAFFVQMSRLLLIWNVQVSSECLMLFFGKVDMPGQTVFV